MPLENWAYIQVMGRDEYAINRTADYVWTRVGRFAMMRRMAGAPIQGEN